MNSAASVAAGFLFGLGLIFSLGPQNLMLIRAGVARNYPLVVASTGYASEVVLVALGIGGLGAALAEYPTASRILQIACAGFLAWWGARILLRLPQTRRGSAAGAASDTLHDAIRSMLVVTWLNPLAWLEAMFLVGVLSSGHDAPSFAAGFLAASAIKFYGWSLAGMGLARHFTGEISLKILDVVTGVVLIAVAVLLWTGLLG
jgi:L-lysine exporter family protein LysE/ArgO